MLLPTIAESVSSETRGFTSHMTPFEHFQQTRVRLPDKEILKINWIKIQNTEKPNFNESKRLAIPQQINEFIWKN